MEILRSVEIFGFSGKMGSGKDFLASALNTMLPPVPTLFIALADQLKIEAIVKGGLDRDKVYGTKDEHTRQTLQRLGTENGRDKFGEDIWIKYLTEWMIQHVKRGIRRFFITDVRFLNEVQFILEICKGYLFRVISPKRNYNRVKRELELQGIAEAEFDTRRGILMNHISETALDTYSFERILYNDPGENSIDNLRNFTLKVYPPILKRSHTDISTSNAVTFFVDLDDTICECYKYYVDIQDKIRKYLGISKENFDSIDKQLNSNWEKKPFYRDGFAVGLVNIARYINKTSFEDEQFVYDLGMSIHDYNFEAIEGAVEAVKLLKQHGKVVIFTIGHRSDQIRKLINLGLHNIIDAVEVCDIKDASLFRVLKMKYPAKIYYMFGDSLTRDIEPAKEAAIDYVYHITKDKSLTYHVSNLFH